MSINAKSLGLDQKAVGGDQREPPKLLMWIPPYGKPMPCTSLEEAGRAATVYAGEHPGDLVCVYELVGKAYIPADLSGTRPGRAGISRSSAPATGQIRG